MCRNIKTLYNFRPRATKKEIEAASLQYIRKVSGYTEPSKVNKKAFEKAVNDVARVSNVLLRSLSTEVKPKNREEEARKAHQRALKRFGHVKK